MHHQDFHSEAVQFLLECRFLSECGVHGYTERGSRELPELWPIAVAEFKRGKAGAMPWAVEMNQRGFTDTLQAAYDNNCGSCIGCSKMERE